MFMTILAALTSMIVIISATGFGQIMNEEVQIAARTFTRIENLSVRPRIVSPDLAKLEVSFDVTDRIKVDEDIRIEAEVRELVAGTERVLGRSERTEPVAASFANTVRSQRLGRKGAGNVSSVCFEIEMVNPKLWWPSGLGDQAMYRIDLMAYFANEGVLEAAGSAKATDTFGIMELGLLDPCGDPAGRPPVIGYKVPFLINRSSPLFVKGTIWARPEDTGSGGDELVKKLIEKAAGVGINAFWIKSDVSESDDFYSLCDKSGILVLRELPSADARGIDLEGKDYLQQCAVLLKRLKDHPCVALWTVSGASSAEIAELEKLCAEIVPGSLLLPGMSAQGDTILWRTSSKRGGCDRCEFGSSQGLNITHWSAVVLENQQGFVSTPVIENLKENLPQASLEREARDNAAETAPSIGSESADEMAETAHTSFSFEQKEPTLPSQLPRVKMSDSATDLLLQMGLQSSSLSSGRELDSKAARELDESASRYELSRRGVNGLLRSPDYLDKYVAVTQLEQAATTQRIVESWRRRGFEGGALFLGQLAETRPGITRSVIDWRGTPKPSYYFLKRAMRDLHICADFRLKDSEPLTVTKSKRFNVDIYVLNNTSETRKNVIASAKVFASNMLMVSSLAKKLDAPSLNSTYAFTLDSTVSEDLEDSMLFMWLGLTDRNGDFLSSNFYSLGALPAAKAFPDVDVLLISDRRYEIESSLTFLDDSGMDLTYVASSDDLTKAAPAYTDYTDDFTEYGDGAEEAGAGQNMDAMDPYARRGYAGPGDPYMYPTNDKGSYDRFGQDTTEQTTNTTQTATPPPNLEDVYDVIIIDAAACEKLDDDKITSIKNAVEKGCGLLICGVGKKLAGTGIESISPVEFVTKGAPDTPNVVTLEIPDHPVLADLPSDRYLQSLGATDIVALNGTDQNALDGNGSILISAGHSTPILAESSYGEGRILAFVPGLDKDAPDALKGMWASMIAYLSKLSYPEMRRAREIQSARPYAGLNMLPKAELEAIVVDDGKEIAAPRPKSQFVVDVYNRSQWLAFQIGLKVRAKSVGATRSTENQAAGAREAQIEADLSDDYFSLIPSEKRRIKITLPDDVIENVGPLKCVVSGWNTNTLELPLPISAKRLASRTETGPPAEAVAESAEVKKETLDLDANTEQSEAGIVENKLERAREAQLQKDHLPLLGMFELARDYLTSGVASRLSNVLRIKPLGATRPPQVNEDQTGVSVGRYDILELSFELNPPDGRHYANPFQDVEVSAAFTSPSGRRGLNRPVDKSGGVVKDIPVEGFYDGGRVWRVRFAPDEIGKWTYTIVAKVSPRAKRRGESDEAVVSGDFECVESSLHGFIEVDPEHPRRLCYHDRTPFLVAGGGAFSPWQTHVTGVLNWEDYLESHSRNGLNAVRLYLYQENHRGPRRKDCDMRDGRGKH